MSRPTLKDRKIYNISKLYSIYFLSLVSAAYEQIFYLGHFLYVILKNVNQLWGYHNESKELATLHLCSMCVNYFFSFQLFIKVPEVDFFSDTTQ